MTAVSLENRLRSSGTWAAVGRILSGVLLLAVHAVLARSLDGVAYGQFVLAESLVLLSVTLCLSGVPTVALRMIREHLSRHQTAAADGVARSAVSLVIVTSLIWMAGLTAGSLFLNARLPGGLSSDWLLWIGTWAIFATGLRLLSEIHKAYDHYAIAYGIGGQSGGLWVNAILFIIVLLLALTERLSLRTAFLMQLFVQGAVLGMAAANLQKSLGGSDPPHAAGTVKLCRLMILSAWPLLAEQLVSVGLPEVGKLMLGTFATAESTGLYNAALRLVVLAHVPLLVINSAIAPFVTELRAAGRNHQLTVLTRGSATIASIPSVAVLVVLFVFAEQILAWAFGPEFVAAAMALRWLVLGSLAFVLTGSCGLVLMMTGHERSCMLATIGPGLLYVAICPFAVQHYGLLGAAACATGLYAGSNLCCLLLVRFHLKMWTSVTFSMTVVRECLKIVRRPAATDPSRVVT